MHTIWDELHRMQAEMDSMMRNLGGLPQLAYSGIPSTHDSNLEENDEEIVATFALPGVSKEDIDVEVSDDAVEVRVERNEEIADENRYSRRYGGYYQRIPLPDNAVPEEIEGMCANGVLTLRIPKREASKKKRRISLK